MNQKADLKSPPQLWGTSLLNTKRLTTVIFASWSPHKICLPVQAVLWKCLVLKRYLYYRCTWNTYPWTPVLSAPVCHPPDGCNCDMLLDVLQRFLDSILHCARVLNILLDGWQVADSYLWDTFVLANEEVFLPWCAVGGRFLVLYNLQGAAQCFCSYVSDQIQDKPQQDRFFLVNLSSQQEWCLEWFLATTRRMNFPVEIFNDFL